VDAGPVPGWCFPAAVVSFPITPPSLSGSRRMTVQPRSAQPASSDRQLVRDAMPVA